MAGTAGAVLVDVVTDAEACGAAAAGAAVVPVPVAVDAVVVIPGRGATGTFPA